MFSTHLRFKLLVLALSLTCLASVSHAHHGPPHEEIDEFEDMAAMESRGAEKFSVAAFGIAVTGVGIAVFLSRRMGLSRSTAQLS